MTSQLFLKLEDAVVVARRYSDMDDVILRQEFMQKCYVSNEQYGIGYRDALDMIEKYIHGVKEDA